jgi:hypothetical protein
MYEFILASKCLPTLRFHSLTYINPKRLKNLRKVCSIEPKPKDTQNAGLDSYFALISLIQYN